MAGWRLAAAGAIITKHGGLHVTENKGSKEVPELDLLAEFVIRARRPRQKGCHEFEV